MAAEVPNSGVTFGDEETGNTTEETNVASNGEYTDDDIAASQERKSGKSSAIIITAPNSSSGSGDEEKPLTRETSQASAAKPGELPPINYQMIALKFFGTVLLVATIAAITEYFFNDQVVAFSKRIMDKLGSAGLFIVVLLADGLPQPVTYIPLIFIAVNGGMSKSEVFLICASATYIAGMFGYWSGRLLRRLETFQNLLARVFASTPQLETLFAEKGSIGVFIGSLMPMPFALVTWTAGSINVVFWQFALASLGRPMKVAFFTAISKLGISHA